MPSIDSPCSLRALLSGSGSFVSLLGTTPPRADATDTIVSAAASKFAQRITDLKCEGIVVYDVQEELGRTSEARPFPFLPTHPSRDYAHLLAQTASKPCIVYKSVAGMTFDDWTTWLSATALTHDFGGLSLVGRATSHGGDQDISLLTAMRAAADHHAGYCVGGVMIPERHNARRSESARMLEKMAAGCAYFISQAVYSPELVIALCRDYARECDRQEISPSRLILTFTPCGRPKTMQFMKWLGVHVPPETEHSILSAESPLAASIEICRTSFRQILEAGVHQLVPLGINVESVSITKSEIAGTVELFRQLQTEAKRFFV